MSLGSTSERPLGCQIFNKVEFCQNKKGSVVVYEDTDETIDKFITILFQCWNWVVYNNGWKIGRTDIVQFRLTSYYNIDEQVHGNWHWYISNLIFMTAL